MLVKNKCVQVYLFQESTDMSFLMVEFRLLPTEQILFMDTKLMLGKKLFVNAWTMDTI